MNYTALLCFRSTFIWLVCWRLLNQIKTTNWEKSLHEYLIMYRLSNAAVAHVIMCTYANSCDFTAISKSGGNFLQWGKLKIIGEIINIIEGGRKRRGEVIQFSKNGSRRQFGNFQSSFQRHEDNLIFSQLSTT